MHRVSTAFNGVGWRLARALRSSGDVSTRSLRVRPPPAFGHPRQRGTRTVDRALSRCVRVRQRTDTNA
jgi:hypothetical protein